MHIEEIILTAEESADLAKELQNQLQEGGIKKPDDNQIKLMIAGLADPRGLHRRTFAEGLGKVGKTALPGLSKALLFSKNVTVRRAAAKTLKLVGDPIALPCLLKALINDKDPVVQGSAAGAIAIFGEKAVNPLFEVLINPKSTSMQCGLASWCLAFIGAEAPNALKNAAHSKHEKIRSAAIAALGDQIQSLEDKEAQDLLLNALDDPSIEVRVEATKLIGRLDKKNWGEQALINQLNDNEEIVRKNAALSLMNMNAIGSLNYLQEKISKERDDEVIKILKLVINQLKKNS
tara:strand:- start:135 stop:1007 length:873 start_codon:yes stop_codon:yes gene_type:complete